MHVLYVPLEYLLFIWNRYRTAKFRPMLSAQGLWAVRDIYRDTPAVTRGLGFSGLIRRPTLLIALFDTQGDAVRGPINFYMDPHWSWNLMYCLNRYCYWSLVHKCYFHCKNKSVIFIVVKIKPNWLWRHVSDHDVMLWFTLKQTCSERKKNVINRKFNALELNNGISFTHKTEFTHAFH
jgi:hypothetical protein